MENVNCRKHCVQSYNVFDFLRDVVSRVPDYSHGHGHAEAGPDDRVITKRRFEVQYLFVLLFHSLDMHIVIDVLTFKNAMYFSRKAIGDDGNDSDEEAKRSKMVIAFFLVFAQKPSITCLSFRIVCGNLLFSAYKMDFLHKLVILFSQKFSVFANKKMYKPYFHMCMHSFQYYQVWYSKALFGLR